MLSQEQIKDFVVQNNVLGYAIAMIIALTLKDFVASFIRRSWPSGPLGLRPNA